MMHIASHASFGRNVNETFLLTYNKKLNLDELEQLIKQRQSKEPLELIALSACKTAKGGERAALGLAGITIKAGAKSALASLWEIDDKATAEFVTEFYRGIAQLKLTKTKALQRVQKKFLKHKNESYRHPNYWAAFILIGNWL